MSSIILRISREAPVRSNLIIVGGGFTGTCVATTAARGNPGLSITLIEERTLVGAGVAYNTMDPDHRLNAPVEFHSIIPTEPSHIAGWCTNNRVFEQDPDAQTEYGTFIRRRDYARYLQSCFLEHIAGPDGAGVRHYQSRAREAFAMPWGYRVVTADGARHDCDALVLATGNPEPSVPAVLSRVADHPAVVVDPWASGQIAAINNDDTVLVVGASLTAADQICTLLRHGHCGAICVVSRNGLRPTHWPLPDKDAPAPDMEAVFNDPPAQWISDALNRGPTIRHLTRAVRTRIRELSARGERWEAGFDEMRNVVWQVWPQLPAVEKKRFLRRVRPWYDVYRFRIPPQTAAILEAGEQSGQLTFSKGTLVRADVRGRTVHAEMTNAGSTFSIVAGALINCTGFNMAAAPEADCLIGCLLQSGQLSRDETGIGFRTDRSGRCIAAHGSAQSSLRLVGPPTAGTWGDPLGAIFIAFQVRRMMPDLLSTWVGQSVVR